MTQPAETQQAPEETGMFAPYEPPEIGEKLDVLDEAGTFVLVEITIRENIKTEHGLRDAVDLRVQTTDPNVQRLFSGFSAGIVGQARRVREGDLPAVCRISPRPTQRGATRELVLVQRIPAGADFAALAKAQPVAIAPIANPNEIPY